jgi:hypothetical protein
VTHQGEETDFLTHIDAGPDGVWQTPDDIVSLLLRYVCTDDGKLSVIAYDGPGADTEWGTMDDELNGSSDLAATSCGPSACEVRGLVPK